MAAKNLRDKYLGQENYNHQGYLMKVVEYNGYDDISVAFDEPYSCIIKSRMGHFKDGGIVNPYAPCICNIGITGNKYPTHTPDGKKYVKEYLTWSNMIKRCYSKEDNYKNKTYYNIVTVCEEWLYYENFYEWMRQQENYIKLIEINDMAIDKDILVKGNKEYRPDRCCLVPQVINNIMLKSNAIRGDLPIGVGYLKRNKKFVARCGGKENHYYLGLYSTPEEAFEVYKQFKENQIKSIATKEYIKGTIIKSCYEALMNYKVEITD